MRSFQISASLLAADFAQLGDEALAVITAGADMVHIDVMDNHYVPNLTVGPILCKALRKYGVTAPIDVHLMISPVDSLIPEFAEAGATYITFHPEASLHVDRTIQLIRDCDCRAGLALNPATSLDTLNYTLTKLDMVLLMSVNPGFGGQMFIPDSLKKLEEVRRMITSSGLPILLEVDGGVKVENIREIAEAGADTFVIGTSIFSTPDYAETLTALRKELKKVKESPG